MRRDGLLLRGMRWRLGASLLTVLTAAVAVATAVLGPLYLHTAGDSLLRRSVATASIPARGVSFSADLNRHLTLADVARDERGVTQSGPVGRYGTPITTVAAGAQLAVPGGGQPKNTQLYWRSDICAHLHFVQGRCELGSGDVIMTARGAQQFGVKLGGTIDAIVDKHAHPLNITGVVATPDLGASYWWGTGAETFAYGPQRGPRNATTKLTDPLIVSPATAAGVPPGDVPTATGQVPLSRDAVDLANERSVQRAQTMALARLNRSDLHPSSRLNTILGAADHQRHVMSTIVAVAAIQLVVLAVWVLASLLVRSGDARRSEARIARLRGFPPSSMLWVTAAEPGLLCLIGAGVGVAIAWGAVVVAKQQLFLPAATIGFDGWALAALGLTLASIVAALGVGTVRLLRSADLSEGATRRPRATSTVSLVADGVLVMLAAVALVALASTGALDSGHSDPLASAAPGLIALGTAVVAVHVILFACRLGVRFSAGSPRVASFLALRQTARRPGVLRQGRVLIIALCLACFATAAWSVARTNRQTAARFQIGSDQVLSVRPTSVAHLESAVARVDPGHRFAMAAVELRTSSTTLLAVDPQRLSATASWPGGISRRALPAVARELAPPTAPALTLPDTGADVTATTTAHGQAAARLANVELGMWLTSPRGGTAVVDLGALARGSHRYHADLRALCPGGCRIAGLGVLPVARRTPPSAGGVRVQVTALSPGSPAALRADGWRPSAPGVHVVKGGTGLTLNVSAAAIDNLANAGAGAGSLAPMVARADRPATLPVVATRTQQTINNAVATGTLPTQGLDGGALNVRPVVTSSALPRVGANGLMVDLDLLSRAQTRPAIPGAIDQVWLGAAAPADAVIRLDAAGLQIVADSRSATVFGQLQKTAPAVADDFLLFATIAALLVAAASTLGALGATTRERATELASLEVAGVPRRTLARSLGLESMILALAALCGAAAGVLAAAMAVPSLPSLPVPGLAPLHYSLPAALLTSVTVVVIAAVVLAALAVTVILLHRMTPALLRTAPDDVSG